MVTAVPIGAFVVARVSEFGLVALAVKVAGGSDGVIAFVEQLRE
jgi:hypothetical protein